ncbi:MAG: efflux RND transporter periplasmic adaptor subunit [Micavibrio sp.]|nr:efflux RND transporter periplasmic adaptor subunit [Micavibrio sp.]
MQNRFPVKTIAVVSIIALAAGIGWKAMPVMAKDDAAAPAAAAAPQAMPISVAAATQREVTRWSEFSGRLRAVEDVQVRPRVGGTIEEMHFQEGDLVKKGDLLFTLDLRPYKAAYDQANAAYVGAKAVADLANSDLKRASALFDQKAYSQREFDEKNNGQKEAVASVAVAAAQVEIAKLNLEYAEIRAPISGRVGRPDITVGNVVEAGGSAPILTTMQSVDPIYADFDIDEQTYLKAMKSVREGKSMDMPIFMGLADEGDFPREGKIRSFDNQLSGDSGTLRVRAEFKNPDGVLTPGLFARIRLGNAEKQTAVLINDSAVGTDQDRKFVYTVDDKGNVNYRPVKLGTVDGGMRIVEDGLQSGEKIIVNGLMRVHPGMQVQPQIVSMETLKPEGADAAPAAAAPAGDAKPAEEKPADAVPAAAPADKAEDTLGKPPAEGDAAPAAPAADAPADGKKE